MFTVLFLVGLTAYGGGPAQSPEVMPTVMRGSAARSGIGSNEPKQISVTPMPARHSSIEKTIWRGQSSGFGIRWTSQNITIAHQSAPSRFLFSAREIAEKEFQAFKKDNVTDVRKSLCTYEESFSLLSVVGSIVSYEQFEDSYCRDSGGKWAWAHPSDDISYRVIDLKRYGKQVVLTDLFSESEILKAILADPLVAKTIQNHQAASTAKTVAELIRLFEEEGLSLEPQAETARAPKGCTFKFPQNLLDQFAFHHLENGQGGYSPQPRT